MLQLHEVVIHHGKIKPLGGWQAVAYAMRTLGRLGHSTWTYSVDLFRLGQNKEQTQVLIDKEGVCLLMLPGDNQVLSSSKRFYNFLHCSILLLH